MRVFEGVAHEIPVHGGDHGPVAEDDDVVLAGIAEGYALPARSLGEGVFHQREEVPDGDEVGWRRACLAGIVRKDGEVVDYHLRLIEALFHLAGHSDADGVEAGLVGVAEKTEDVAEGEEGRPEIVGDGLHHGAFELVHLQQRGPRRLEGIVLRAEGAAHLVLPDAGLMEHSVAEAEEDQ